MQTLERGVDEVDANGTVPDDGVGRPSHGSESASIDTAADPPAPQPPARRIRARWEPIKIVGFALLALGVLVTFVKLGGVGRTGGRDFAFRWPWDWRPGDMLHRTTPTGGDMGSHVWTPDYLRRHVLGQGRLTGWADDWYAGFPVVAFYFPLPMWTIALLSFVLPYGVAFKLVTVVGLLGLPAATWAFGRLAGLPRPYPVLLGLAAFPYIFSVHYDEQIYGGTITATMAGEFAFSISLALSMLFLGYWVHVLRTGKKRGPAALALAATGLSHLLPAMFVLATAALFLLTELGVRHIKKQLRDSLIIGAIGAALAAFWLLPFKANLAYTNNMGWEPKNKFVANLFPFWPSGWPWKHHKISPNTTPPVAPKAPVTSAVIAVAFLFALVAFGCAMVALVRWMRGRQPTAVERFSLAFGSVAVISGVLFTKLGYFRLWNARVLPFWFLAIYLLAAVGFAQVGKSLATTVRWLSRGSRSWKGATTWGTAFAGLVTYIAIGSNLGLLPDHLPIPKDRNGLLGVQFARSAAVDANYGPGWALYNFAGYEKRSAWTEYQQLMSAMRRVGATNGCGRAMWENAGKGGRDMGRFGTPMALMLLPYWTRSCIGSMEGLYFESSATTPYHFMNAALLSQVASTAQRDLPYGSFDMTKGVQKMQGFGVKYYLAFSGHAQQEADKNADLRLVATSPLSGQCDAEEQKQWGCPVNWKIYEVAKSELVTPLALEPARAKGIGQAQDDGWLDMSVNIYNDPNAYPVPIVASGPKTWQEVKVTRKPKPKGVRTYGVNTTVGAVIKRTLPAVVVSNIKHSTDTLSFDVDKPNVPVLVKISYFPNWKVEGGKGPYRVSPNFMVVIPTKNHVKLRYGRTKTDLVSYALLIVGLGAVVKLRRRDRDDPELQGVSALDPGFTPEGNPKPGQTFDGTPNAGDHLGAGGSGFADHAREFGGDITGPFDPQDQFGVEEIDTEEALFSEWGDVDPAHGLHSVGVGDLEPESVTEQEGKDSGHESS